MPSYRSTVFSWRAALSLRDLWVWVVFEAHIEPLEVWTSLNGLLWGLWVLNPWVAIFSTAPGYATMGLVPEWLWGGIATIASVLQLLGRLRGHPSWQRAGARSLASLWMFSAVALGYQNWRWPAVVTYPMLAAASLLVSFRAVPNPRRPAHRPIVPIDREDAYGHQR